MSDPLQLTGRFRGLHYAGSKSHCSIVVSRSIYEVVVRLDFVQDRMTPPLDCIRCLL